MKKKKDAKPAALTALKIRRWQKGHLVIVGKNPIWVGRWNEDAVDDNGNLYRKQVSVRLGCVADYSEEEARKMMAEEIRKMPQITAKDKKFIGSVYFVQAATSKYVKIGFTNTHGLKSRLKHLQIGSPDALNLVGLLPGNKNTEIFFHNMFAAEHVAGEWFECSERLSAFIAWMKFEPQLIRKQPKRALTIPMIGTVQ